MADVNLNADIVIVGGGLVGMSLAIGLAKSPCRVILLERSQNAPLHHNVLDLRTTGLAMSSKVMFSRLGLWEKIVKAASPIDRLDVSEQANFGVARIDAKQHGISSIGYMVPNDHLMEVLSKEVMQLPNLTIMSPASCESIERCGNAYRLGITHGQEYQQITASLVVGADGSNSKVRDLLNITATHKKYNQTAIITNVCTQKPHNNVAYERFTQHGPLAVLPIQKNYCALIWTQPDDHVDYYLSLDDRVFMRELQKAFGYRLGRFLAVGQRVGYPLTMITSDQLTCDTAVLVGNAAQTVHPVAAQGFNLGLRDVQTLIHMLNKIDFNPDCFPDMLTEYEHLRDPDRQHVIRLTDGLTRLFAPQIWPAKILRGVGIRMIGNFYAAQRSILRRNMGLRYLPCLESDAND